MSNKAKGLHWIAKGPWNQEITQGKHCRKVQSTTGYQVKFWWGILLIALLDSCPNSSACCEEPQNQDKNPWSRNRRWIPMKYCRFSGFVFYQKKSSSRRTFVSSNVNILQSAGQISFNLWVGRGHIQESTEPLNLKIHPVECQIFSIELHTASASRLWQSDDFGGWFWCQCTTNPYQTWGKCSSTS